MATVLPILGIPQPIGASTTISDEPASDYVFAASGWNTTQTTIVIDGVGSWPDVKTLTFNTNVAVPLTLQIGQDNTLFLDPSSTGATTITIQTGVTETIAGSSGATIQLGDDQQWSVAGNLQVSAVIWDDGETPAPGFTKTGAGTLILERQQFVRRADQRQPRRHQRFHNRRSGHRPATWAEAALP